MHSSMRTMEKHPNVQKNYMTLPFVFFLFWNAKIKTGLYLCMVLPTENVSLFSDDQVGL